MTPIVMITDNNYTIATLTAIQSIIQNYLGNKQLDIYIIGVSLSDEYVSIFANLNYENANIHLIQEQNLFTDRFQKKGQYVTSSALIKFEISNIMKDFDKVLYLDGDILVRGDVTQLLELDIKRYYAAVVEDMDCVLDRKDNKRLKKEHYFNSGVLLLNCSRLRDDKLPQKMLEVKQNRTDIHYMDQDVFNIIFNNNVMYLEPKFNFMCGYDFYPLKTINKFFKTKYTDVKSMNDDVLILHMAGRCKPWLCQKGNHIEEWLYYYNKIPIKKISLQSVVNKTNKWFITKSYISNEITTVSIGKIELVRKIRYRGFSKYKFFGIGK